MLVVYSKDNCSQCKQAIMLLNFKGVEYKVKKLGVNYTKEDVLKISPTLRSFPLITEVLESCTLEEFESPIGGLDDLKAYLNN